MSQRCCICDKPFRNAFELGTHYEWHEDNTPAAVLADLRLAGFTDDQAKAIIKAIDNRR